MNDEHRYGFCQINNRFIINVDEVLCIKLSPDKTDKMLSILFKGNTEPEERYFSFPTREEAEDALKVFSHHMRRI